MNDIYGTFFGNTPPARGAVEVARLPRGAPVKIELIAAETQPRAATIRTFRILIQGKP